MAKLRTNGKKKNGILKLTIVMEKLQKSLFSDSNHVPKDVKQGHFAVIAEDVHELKRFVVPLSYLAHPSFRRLLEQAAEVYGFDHEGALTVPCHPRELERLLAERY
ncbi:auxin-induced protein 15A-like [Actinidia eriantha]|uniref:auxin-induced protein 15A-like n=1 Tax=Actinidia eriantha TaxID=165200 RepID=UPI002585E0DF|nr:auxin-induced protein 15A-like [Actinidia eriantha]